MDLRPLLTGVGGRSDGAGGSGGGGKGASVLHRGLVITEAVRAELLNPMSHRFKLLRGAH